jgi:hypothetical protein
MLGFERAKLNKTQKDSVRAHLRKGLEITPLDALEQYNIFRLAAIIFDLKREGLRIKTNKVKNRYGKKFASYKLIQEEVEDAPPDYRKIMKQHS